MNNHPKFLDDDQLRDQLGLKKNELREVYMWGFKKSPAGRGVNLDYLKRWISEAARYPGIFLQEKFAAAFLGLTTSEFQRRLDIFKTARAILHDQIYLKPEHEQLYWKHRLKEIYHKNLKPYPYHIYQNLLESHKDFAKNLDLSLTKCVVCEAKAVYTICEKCGNPVDPAHCEAFKDGRPFKFSPAEVCFKCIKKDGYDKFDFFRDSKSVQESVTRAFKELPKK